MVDRLPPPPFWRVPYFERQIARPDRVGIEPADVIAAMSAPVRSFRQADGRMRYWTFVERERRWLRVVVEPDGETVLNAFWDRSFHP